jgi:hypothetical protein
MRSSPVNTSKICPHLCRRIDPGIFCLVVSLCPTPGLTWQFSIYLPRLRYKRFAWPWARCFVDKLWLLLKGWPRSSGQSNHDIHCGLYVKWTDTFAFELLKLNWSVSSSTGQPSGEWLSKLRVDQWSRLMLWAPKSLTADPIETSKFLIL